MNFKIVLFIFAFSFPLIINSMNRKKFLKNLQKQQQSKNNLPKKNEYHDYKTKISNIFNQYSTSANTIKEESKESSYNFSSQIEDNDCSVKTIPIDIHHNDINNYHKDKNNNASIFETIINNDKNKDEEIII